MAPLVSLSRPGWTYQTHRAELAKDSDLRERLWARARSDEAAARAATGALLTDGYGELDDLDGATSEDDDLGSWEDEQRAQELREAMETLEDGAPEGLGWGEVSIEDVDNEY